MIINIELGEFPVKRPVIPAEETVSQFAKYVIPDSPAQPGVIRNPGFIT
jgi:hypothetical protein